MSESCFSSIVHKDFHEAMMAKKDAEIEALRAEIAKLRAEREELRKALKNALLYVSHYAAEFDELVQARALAEKGE